MSSSAPPSDRPLSIRRIPDPAEPVPRVAWPSVGLLAAGLGLWCVASAAALTGVVPWWVATLLNAVAAFLLFTVTHEAWHHTTSTNSTLNAWMGRVSTAFFAPFAGFGMARYIHMQHHRFTNEPGGKDPDHFLVHGRWWTAPLRWQSIDVYYFRFYLRHLRERPAHERREAAVTFLLTAAVAVACGVTGHLWEFLYLYILPSRIQLLSLGYAFAYLPHHGLPDTPATDRYRTTRVRVGAERLLTPLMLYQNYHLVHHLHPVVPFYKYVQVWRRNEDEYLANDPAIVTAGGRPLTADEYRELQRLRDHDH